MRGEMSHFPARKEGLHALVNFATPLRLGSSNGWGDNGPFRNDDFVLDIY